MNYKTIIFLLLILAGCSSLIKDKSLEEKVYSTYLSNAKKEYDTCQKYKVKIENIREKDQLTKKDKKTLNNYLKNFPIASHNRSGLISYYLVHSPEDWSFVFDKDLNTLKTCDTVIYFDVAFYMSSNHWKLNKKEHDQALSNILYNIKNSLNYTQEPLKLQIQTSLVRRLLTINRLKASEITINEISRTIMYSKNIYSDFSKKIDPNKAFSINAYKDYYEKSRNIAEHLSLLMKDVSFK